MRNTVPAESMRTDPTKALVVHAFVESVKVFREPTPEDPVSGFNAKQERSVNANKLE
jgi:hypothetical protein